jgi:hypothetical protein
MSPDPLHSSSSAGTAERRQAVWPFALILFFALRAVKEPPPLRHAAHPETAVESAPSEAPESR